MNCSTGVDICKEAAANLPGEAVGALVSRADLTVGPEAVYLEDPVCRLKML